MNKNEEFGKRISELRKEKGLSQKQLGELLEVSNKAVSKWETGESFPQTKTIIRIAEIFSMSPDELMTGVRPEAQKSFSAEDTKRIDRLETENAQLKNALSKTDKSRKKTLIISSVFVLLCFILIILLSFLSKSSIYPVVVYAGNENTKVEFSGKTFYPADDFEKCYLASEHTYTDEKYALFFDPDANKTQIKILCSSYENYIIVPSGKSRYYYVDSEMRFSVSAENISRIAYLKNSGSFNSELDIFCSLSLWDDSNEVLTLYNKNTIELFCKYYNEKTEPENAKDITKTYFANHRYEVFLSLSNLPNSNASIAVGVIFEDNNKNLYFFDYTNSKTYVMGREVIDNAI